VAAGFIRIQVAARPINPADRLFMMGIYDNLVGTSIQQGLPQTGGSEGAGIIVAVGEGVTKFAKGQRVYVSCNFPNTGSWGEYVDVSAEKNVVVPIPAEVTFTQACQLFVSKSLLVYCQTFSCKLEFSPRSFHRSRVSRNGSKGGCRSWRLYCIDSRKQRSGENDTGSHQRS
jgi:NADPH:quinone reductase-like Zn-dependent oxidoreductase